jgi:aerobic-type carbon monoxide dehydrogenase small subunit (CoxS/CutS family)
MTEMSHPGNQGMAGTVRITVNGKGYSLEIGDAPHKVQPWHTLLHTIRETLGLTGTKEGCDEGACGACTVIADGEPVLSCMMLTIECGGKNITTIEGLGDHKTGGLHPLQQSFIDHGAFQCGFCTPGIIMASKALTDEKTEIGEEDVKSALSGHYCRCISHYQVVDAVVDAAKRTGELK